MNYVLILLLLITVNVNAHWKDTGQYDQYRQETKKECNKDTKSNYRYKKAKQRARAHPKGSGIDGYTWKPYKNETN